MRRASLAVRERLVSSELKVAFYTKNLSVDFLRPVFGDQPFVIRSLLAERDEGSCQVTCEMLDERERPLARCTMHLVCVDKETKRPGTWPQGFMEKFYE